MRTLLEAIFSYAHGRRETPASRRLAFWRLRAFQKPRLLQNLGFSPPRWPRATGSSTTDRRNRLVCGGSCRSAGICARLKTHHALDRYFLNQR